MVLTELVTLCFIHLVLTLFQFHRCREIRKLSIIFSDPISDREGISHLAMKTVKSEILRELNSPAKVECQSVAEAGQNSWAQSPPLSPRWSCQGQGQALLGALGSCWYSQHSCAARISSSAVLSAAQPERLPIRQVEKHLTPGSGLQIHLRLLGAPHFAESHGTAVLFYI